MARDLRDYERKQLQRLKEEWLDPLAAGPAALTPEGRTGLETVAALLPKLSELSQAIYATVTMERVANIDTEMELRHQTPKWKHQELSELFEKAPKTIHSMLKMEEAEKTWVQRQASQSD